MRKQEIAQLINKIGDDRISINSELERQSQPPQNEEGIYHTTSYREFVERWFDNKAALEEKTDHLSDRNDK